MNNKIRAIITGATGMVGEGVLHECLQHPQVEAVLVINRKPLGLTHPKLKELVHSDFYDFAAIENQLSGYNACFFCLGVTSVGKKEPEYYKLTYDLTLHVAQTLSSLNKDMTFCYVSGAGTDSTEKGKLMWARVKGKTENDLFKLPFKQVFAFRPGIIKPTLGLKYTHFFYKLLGWVFPIIKVFSKTGFCTLEELGLAMIYVAHSTYPNNKVEVKDIIELAQKERQL